MPCVTFMEGGRFGGTNAYRVAGTVLPFLYIISFDLQNQL